MKWKGDKELGHATELIRKIVEIRAKKERDRECRVGRHEMDQLNVIYLSDTLNSNLVHCLYIRACKIHLIYIQILGSNNVIYPTGVILDTTMCNNLLIQKTYLFYQIFEHNLFSRKYISTHYTVCRNLLY